MSNVVDVVTGEMRQHASRLERIARDGERGVEAARTVSVEGDAFGLLCSFLGSALNPVEAVGVLTTQGAVAGIDGMAASVRGLATLFEETDDGVEAGFRYFRNHKLAERAVL